MKLKHDIAITNGKYCHKLAWSRAKKLHRLALYSFTKSERKKILLIYVEAQLKNMSNKRVKFNVDHIIPLKSELVCGLHVSSNLQIISSTRNALKGNKFSSYSEKNGQKVFLNSSGTSFKSMNVKNKGRIKLKFKQSKQKLVKKRLKIAKKH